MCLKNSHIITEHGMILCDLQIRPKHPMQIWHVMGHYINPPSYILRTEWSWGVIIFVWYFVLLLYCCTMFNRPINTFLTFYRNYFCFILQNDKDESCYTNPYRILNLQCSLGSLVSSLLSCRSFNYMKRIQRDLVFCYWWITSIEVVWSGVSVNTPTFIIFT